MKKYFNKIIIACLALAGFTSCDPQDNDDHELGAPAPESAVSFSVTPSADNANIVELKNTSTVPGVAVWDLGNGSTVKGESVTQSFPFAGEYTISLSLYTRGGVTTKTQNITIANNDPSQIPANAVLLAGGMTGSKTWVFDRTHDGHFGVGPADADGPSWWSCPAEGKADCSLYENEFTFNLDGNYNMVWKNKGNVYSNDAGKGALGGTAVAPPAGDWDITYTPKEAYTFTVSGDQLVLSDGAFFGHYAGTSTYKILNLTEDELYIMCASTVENGNGWWYRFIPKK